MKLKGLNYAGFEVSITPLQGDKAFELVFTVGFQGLSWIFDKEREGVFANVGEAHGYPFKYEMSWAQVLEWLGTRRAGEDGTMVINVEEGEVSSSNAQGRAIFDAAAFKPDDMMLLTAWDLS